MASEVKRCLHVERARPRRAIGRAPASSRARGGGRRAPACRRPAPGSRRSPSRTTVAVPPALVATTGQPLASASIATTGVPSFSEVSRKASKRAVPAAHVAAVAEEAAALPDAELRRELLDALPLGAVADDDEVGVDAERDELGERADEVVRPLDRGQPPGPADDERSPAGSPIAVRRAPARPRRARESPERSKP